ncbi:helix-turn-helix transcriptional regulator [Nocardiopsis metallicus]|nr:helix-turn-helix transcriptional regulator [Nocardiopsis metallicus]
MGLLHTQDSPSSAKRWEIGRTIKELRQALDLSQARLANLLANAGGATVDRSHISRWENGRCAPSPYWLRHLAVVLQVPMELLTMDRRNFLTHAAGTAIAPVVASDLLSSGFDAALRSAAPSAEEWEAKVVEYGKAYMVEGAAEIQKRLAADLLVLQQQVEDPHSWSVAARLATLYAKTFPGSDGVKAVTWYRYAARFADRSEEDQVRVWVRGRAAIALGYEGAALGVADLLSQQALAVDERPSLGVVNAVMGQAHVAALRGDHDRALELVEDGRRAFDSAGSDDAPSDYAVPWWRFNVFISLLAARLGDERLADEAQAEAARHLPDSLPRFKTHLEMHRGLMLARQGDPSGSDLAQSALDQLPPEKHSLTLRLLMEEIQAAAA